MKPTRTPATETDYARRARQLVTRLARELGMADCDDVCAADVVRYLDQRRADLAPESWRVYKASLSAFARDRSEADEAWREALKAIEAMRWSSAGSAPKARRPKRTSAWKDKSPSDERLEQLQNCLTLHDAQAAAFLSATLLTGLRPIEWCAARLVHVGDRAVLFVRNAKKTNGRAHGNARRLWFDGQNFQQARAVRTTIAVFRIAWKNDGYDALLERMQRAFRRAAETLWPRQRRTITPYSARHAFAARVKLVYAPEEIAALMGHGVDTTASSHSGRRRKKTAGRHRWPLPKADPRDVARVRKDYAKSLAALATAKAKTKAAADPARTAQAMLAEEAEVDSTLRP
jgi:hypothetical protein